MEYEFPPKRNKSSPAQLRCLSKHMQSHPDMAAGMVPGSRTLQERINLDLQWTELANKLNSLGGPVKPVGKWKQAWRDMRNNTKKREFHKKQEIQDAAGITRDGQEKVKEQSTDEKVLSILCPVTVYEMEEIICTEPNIELSQKPTIVQMTSRTEPETNSEVLDSPQHNTAVQRPLPKSNSATRKRLRVVPTTIGSFHKRLLMIERQKLRIKKQRNDILEERNCILNR